MVKVKMEFELEDLKDVKLLIEDEDKYREVYLRDFRKGLVKIGSPTEEESEWVKEAELKVVDIFFR